MQNCIFFNEMPPECAFLTLGNLGACYLESGELRRTIESCERHLPLAREIGDRQGESRALGNLGLAYAALGQVEKAIG